MHSKVIKVRDEEYRFIHYYKIITKISENNITPINGNILFTTLKLVPNTMLIIPDKFKIQDPRYGIVEYISPANEYYLKKENKDLDKGIDISVGDKIIFVKPLGMFAPILEDKIHRVLDKEYYYCQRLRISGKFV